MNRKRLVLAGIVFLLLVSTAGAQQQPATPRPDLTVKDVDAALHNDWFGQFSQKKRIGYHNMALEKINENGQTYYRARELMAQKLNISGKHVVYKEEQFFDFDSTPPFRLVRAELHFDDGQVKQQLKLAVNGKEIETTQTTGKVTTRKNQPTPDYTLGDRLALTVWLKNRPGKGDTITFREFSLSTGSLTQVTAKMIGAREDLHQGDKRKVHQIEISIPDIKGTGTFQFDDDGRLLSASLNEIVEMRRESERDAKNLEAGDDLYEHLSARIDRPLGDLRSVTGIVLEGKGKEVGSIPNGSVQKVVSRGDDTYVVKLGQAHGSKVRATEKEIKEALEETADYPIRDAKVLELAAKAVEGARTDQEKVQRLCEFVHQYITPTMDEAGKMAEVRDIIERKRGVCRHFARLFTCLSRAVDLPSREVTGLVYMSDESKSFGPHAWNEVVLDGHWVEIDPTANWTALRAFHLRLGAGKDGEANLVATAGKLSFKVLEVERAKAEQAEDVQFKPHRQPVNLDFKAAELDGWVYPKVAADAGYFVLATEKDGKRCAVVGRDAKGKAEAFGNLMQCFDAAEFRGKRVRLRAWVRADVRGEGNQAQLWLRVDGKNNAVGFFDNMNDRPIVANEWRAYEIVGEVDTDAVAINIGLMLHGNGRAWMRDVTFEVLPDQSGR
jgi:hypothetical protein